MTTEQGPDLLEVCKAELASANRTTGAVAVMYAAYARVAPELAREELQKLELRLITRESELAIEAIRARKQENPALEAKP